MMQWISHAQVINEYSSKTPFKQLQTQAMAVSGSQHDDDEIEELLSADQNDINSGWYIVDTPKGMRISRRGYEAIQPPSKSSIL